MSVMVICGRLGNNAELRTTTGGKKVAQFSVADDIGFGENKKTQWVKCLLWGDRAVKIEPYLTKGSMVEVSGSPSVETWKDKSGEPRGNITLSVSDVKLHGGKRDGEPVADRAPATQRNDLNDDIPF